MLSFTVPAFGHDGRRFEVQVVDNQLVAQGYLDNIADDGGGLVRPYVNAIHGHFSNGGPGFAFATLPGYDILGNADALIGHDLTWEAVGFSVWRTPAMSGSIVLDVLGAGEQINVLKGLETVDSSLGLGSIELLSSVGSSTVLDLDLSYEFYGDHPNGEIYVIESRLTTSAPGIADSGTIYTLLSPDGSTMAERLHHQSLHAESELGTFVPEPSSLAIAALLPLLMRRRR